MEESGAKEIREICASFNELSERLAEQKKSQLRFLAAVAHDLRNPLGAIKMSSQLLTDENYSRTEAAPIIQIIARQAEQLDRMVGDLLDSTRIESGQLEIQPSTQDLVTLVEDSVGLYSSVSQVHKIEFSSQLSEVFATAIQRGLARFLAT
ncbi:MAG: HAMP domain-containing histidine kinase [Bdellovibrionaceae bacterium]|nr:HAMP domain-containing histidine kinase [Pseudobdellovibrionaceae bacterium]